MNEKPESIPALDSGRSPLDSNAGPSTLDSTSIARRQRRPWLVFMLFVPFLASVFGAWAWFNTDIGRSGSRPSTLDSGHPPRLWLTARTNIPGYTFIPEPVSESVMKTLGTTNILSGTFHKIGDSSPQYGDRSPVSSLQPSNAPASRVTVFLASWPPGDNKGLTALQHTPDICWGGSGWKPLHLGQPSQITIAIPATAVQMFGDSRRETGDRKTRSTDADSTASRFPPPVSITFDFRLFQLPNNQNREAVAWCTLAGGQPLIGTTEWGRESISQDSVANSFWSRTVQLEQVLQAVKNRLPIRREKQFARFSVPLSLDWLSGICTLKDLGTVWLTAGPL